MFKQLYLENKADELFNKLKTELEYVPRKYMTFRIFGKTFELPRDKQFYGDIDEDGSTPLYRYGSDWYPPVLEFPSILKEIRDDIFKVTGQYCNHVVVNRYKSGKDHIGFHHDKTKDFNPNTGVYTVSLGQERVFQMQNCETKLVTSYIAKNGSLCILNAEDNIKYKHRIAKTSKNIGERISLTFRSIKSKRTKEENDKAFEKMMS